MTIDNKRYQSPFSTFINEIMDLTDRVGTAGHTYPKMNISECDADYIVDVCVPGLGKEDLSLSIDADNNLVVEVTRSEEAKSDDEQRRVIRKEFERTHFKQLLTLPENVKRERITAHVENGIMRITLPKYTDEEKRSMAQSITID